MNFKNLKGMDWDTSVLILGDLHGTWRKANFLIAKYKPLIVLQCGDFGWWPRFHKTTHISSGVYRNDPMYGIRRESAWNMYGLKPGDAKVYWCPGNHEDWEDLNRRADSYNPIHVEVYKNVFYMPRCATLLLPDGRNVLFMGGAASTDKEYRRYRYDWYPEETITLPDVRNLPDTDIDIVISHTSPAYFKQELFEHSDDWRQSDSFWLEKFRDPSCLALDAIWEKYRPALWFFGHYHVAKYAQYRNTKWFALNKESSTGWWTFLPKVGV
jgi:hypothetical protein